MCLSLFPLILLSADPYVDAAVRGSDPEASGTVRPEQIQVGEAEA